MRDSTANDKTSRKYTIDMMRLQFFLLLDHLLLSLMCNFRVVSTSCSILHRVSLFTMIIVMCVCTRSFIYLCVSKCAHALQLVKIASKPAIINVYYTLQFLLVQPFSSHAFLSRHPFCENDPLICLIFLILFVRACA